MPTQPLDYHPPTPPTSPPRWRTLALSLLGLPLGLAITTATLYTLSLLFPTASRAQTSTQATILLFTGLATALAAVPAGIFRRYLLATTLASAGLSSAFVAFAIGIMSGINC